MSLRGVGSVERGCFEDLLGDVGDGRRMEDLVLRWRRVSRP